ncbi:YcxB family protein [Lacrimispora sp.]|uniref:YcxB family protein n=1 Tax=Lacrimispora sp. TaxID=2719234 RepID=UPI0028B0501F|nr:YcxB family protein [Lacrimispora sp.]
MEPAFVVSVSINKKILKSFEKYLLRPSFNLFINIVILICVSLAICLFFLRFNSLANILLIGALFIYIEKILGRKIIIKKLVIAINFEQNYILKFYDDYMTISKELEESGFNIDYSNISRITETKKYVVLFTRENMCFPVHKTFYNDNEKYEWLDYIVDKNKKIKLYNIQ